MGSWRTLRRWIALAISALLVSGIFIALSASPASASTVGVVSGVVTDASTGAPLANVSVTAQSPSGRYGATTDSHGFYSMTGVQADTYTMNFDKTGFQPLAVPGVGVFADQTQTVSVKLWKELRTIANVRSAAVGSAYRPSQTTDTYSVTAPQVQNFQGTVFNSDESNLIASLPGGMYDSSGYPVIHGGREYENDFEFEGIPYTDAYSNQFVNSLAQPTIGVAEVQLTPGAGNATVSTNGQGSFNVVAKRGTYPTYFDFGTNVRGGGEYDHGFIADWSWATPDSRFSNYMTFQGSNSVPIMDTRGLPLAYVGGYGDDRLDTNREFLDNFVFRFGPGKNQSLQLFADIAQHNFYTGQGGLSNLCFMTCDPVITQVYGGIWGLSPAQMTAITPMIAYQTSPNETLADATRSPTTYYQPNQAFKAEYTINLNPSTYLSEEWYRVNSTTIFDIANTLGGITGDGYIYQGGQTTGSRTEFTKQLNRQNLLQLAFDYNYILPDDQWISPTFQYFGTLIGTSDQFSLPYAFIKPSDPNCPVTDSPTGYDYCGYAYGANPSASQLQYPPFDQIDTVDREDYSLGINDQVDFNAKLKADFGIRADHATYLMPAPGVDPATCTSEYLPQTWLPNPAYKAPLDASGNPTGATFGNGNCPFLATYGFNNDYFKPTVWQPRTGLSYEISPDTAIRFTYNRSVTFPPIATVAFGQIDPNFYGNPYGKLPAYNAFYNATSGCAPVTPSNPNGVCAPGLSGLTQAQQIANQLSTNCGINGTVSGNSLLVPCTNFGEQLYWIAQNFDGIPFQPVKPETANNYQVTLEHQFSKGFLNGVAVSIAPWTRHQYDTTAQQAQLVLSPSGQPLVVNGQIVQGPAVFNNNAHEYASGIDLDITRVQPYGLSGQVTASYINEFSSVIPLSGSEDFYPNIPAPSILAGNVYRVGFLSPFQATLALSYKTRSGWTFNPRYYYDIGYPSSTGTLTAAIVNGAAINVPNTDAVVGSSPNGPAYYVDPLNPGSVFKPNVIGTNGTSMTSSPGGKLSPPNGTADFTLTYAPPASRWTFGVNVNNVFDEIYNGAVFNDRLAPIAQGVAGPLTGYSSSGTDYASNAPYAWPRYDPGLEYGQQTYVDFPNTIPRNYYFFIQVKI